MLSEEEYLVSLLDNSKTENYSQITFINQRICPFVKYFKDRVSVKYIEKGHSYSDIAVKNHRDYLKF